MRVLVFQHIDCEHPGSLRNLLARDGADWVPVHLHRGEPIPSLESFDALWVMGGPMDVWDVEEHPWLVPEKAAIRRWVRELNRPFLGICLGASAPGRCARRNLRSAAAAGNRCARDRAHQ